jgi:hypothetical protein
MTHYKEAFFWLIGVTATLSMLLGGWTMSETVELESRLTVIEDSRFNKADALVMEIKMRRELALATQEIKDCLNNIQKGNECE